MYKDVLYKNVYLHASNIMEDLYPKWKLSTLITGIYVDGKYRGLTLLSNVMG